MFILVLMDSPQRLPARTSRQRGSRRIFKPAINAVITDLQDTPVQQSKKSISWETERKLGTSPHSPRQEIVLRLAGAISHDGSRRQTLAGTRDCEVFGMERRPELRIRRTLRFCRASAVRAPPASGGPRHLRYGAQRCLACRAETLWPPQHLYRTQLLL